MARRVILSRVEDIELLQILKYPKAFFGEKSCWFIRGRVLLPLSLSHQLYDGVQCTNINLSVLFAGIRYVRADIEEVSIFLLVEQIIG